MQWSWFHYPLYGSIYLNEIDFSGLYIKLCVHMNLKDCPTQKCIFYKGLFARMSLIMKLCYKIFSQLHYAWHANPSLILMFLGKGSSTMIPWMLATLRAWLRMNFTRICNKHDRSRAAYLERSEKIIWSLMKVYNMVWNMFDVQKRNSLQA